MHETGGGNRGLAWRSLEIEIVSLRQALKMAVSSRWKHKVSCAS